MQIYSIAGLSVLTTLLGAVGLGSTAYAADPPVATPARASQKAAPLVNQRQPLEFKLSETTTLQILQGQLEPGKSVGDRGVSRSADALKAQPPTLPAQPVTAEQPGSQPPSLPLPLSPAPPLSPLTQAPATTTGEVQILSPKQTVTSQKFTDLVVRYPTGAKVQVTVNQQP